MAGQRGQSDRNEAIVLVLSACQRGARKRNACEILGISLRTFERWERTGTTDGRQQPKHSPHNKLSHKERQTVISVINNQRYRDLPFTKIVPTLADHGYCIASESTIYRIARRERLLGHRHQTRPVRHHKPRAHNACGPNQVWNWDITYLPTQVRGQYFYLYLITDSYSRKMVGWSIHDSESSGYASRLIKQACSDEPIGHTQPLVLHSDNGTPMKGATMLATLEKLGVITSFSRPSVSDDNPYSESLFRTLKYHPTFPRYERFVDINAARRWTENFVNWYNRGHLHSGLKFVTPCQRHLGEDTLILEKRQAVYQQAK